jgi:RNA polymerase sigma-70 factor, ECF subfamily
MTEVDLFQSHRPALFAVAYRMLGSASDAEDVVQDAWLRYARAQPADLRSPHAYLTTIVTRLCLDRLKSARAAREQYVGPWLPEPVFTGRREGPEQSLALAESVTLAFLVLLETLSPEEPAVFLLREVFDHEYDEIAATLETTSANCRQLFHRAKMRIVEKRPRFRDAVDEKRPLVRRFVRALRDGDADELTRVLAEDVGFWSDGGGKVPAARRPVFGRDSVVSLLLGIRRSALSAGIPPESVALDIAEVNHEPAMVLRVAGRVDSVYTLSVVDDVIASLRIIRNPDKLRFMQGQLAGSHPQ